MRQIRAFLIFSTIISTVLFAQEKFKLDSPFDTLQVDKDTIVIEKSEKLAVAILKLDGNNITEAETKALSDRLRIEVFNAGVYEVMEREKMNRILDEMQFQLSDCTSDECAIEIGRLIGVNKMIAGSISKVGEFYTVSIRLIDVETGKIEATATEDIEGTLGIILTKAIPSIAYQISGLGKLETIPVISKTALNISTDPIGVHIYIDGLYKGESPLEIEVEPGYKHRLKAVAEFYETWEKVYELQKDQILDIAIALSKKPIEKKEKSRERRSYRQGFRVRYVQTGQDKKINGHIQLINNNLYEPTKLFKEEMSESNVSFPSINSFYGIEIYNTRQVADNISFDFGLGFFRADLGSWIKKNLDLGDIGDLIDEDENYSLVTWSPQLTLNLRLAPIRYPLFYPYFNIGFGYNLLFMTAYEDEKSLGGPIYHSWGLIYGIGFEIRFLKPVGVAIEWNRRKMNMVLMDIDKVTDNFKEYELDEIDMTGNNIGVSLNLYY
ncbi:MAG: PEGA domain-containing protein [Candidatus Marinimicrobia bacterium]|nr:PEGA domain-containing protein [Candidatus Neomarinimicrobiota bacterium]